MSYCDSIIRVVSMYVCMDETLNSFYKLCMKINIGFAVKLFTTFTSEAKQKYTKNISMF